MSRLLSFCAVAASLSSASAQAPKLEAVKILKDISSRAEAAKEYAFEGRMQIGAQRGAEPGKILIQAKIRFAVGAEGKYLLDIDAVDKGQYLLLSNGEKSWAYVPKLKQYSEEEIGASEDNEAADTDSTSGRDLAEFYTRLVVPILSHLYANAAQVAPAADAELIVRKKKVKGPVVRVASKPDSKGSASLAYLVFDPRTLQLGRLVYTTSAIRGGYSVVTRLTVDFSSLKLGESLPDSSFTFVPPKNAKLVESVPIPGETGSVLLNHPAPEFDLKTLDGQRMRLSDLHGHPVLLDFWASWCGPCRHELPGIVKLAEEYRDQGLIVLGVNAEGKGTARAFAAKNGLNFAILDDSDRQTNRAYRVRAIPAVFLIDSEGKVVRFLLGSHPYEALKSSLKAVGL